jgi:hypothetical protein
MEYDILTLQGAVIGGRCVSLQLALLLLNLFLEGLEVEEALGALRFQLLKSEFYGLLSWQGCSEVFHLSPLFLRGYLPYHLGLTLASEFVSHELDEWP